MGSLSVGEILVLALFLLAIGYILKINIDWHKAYKKSIQDTRVVVEYEGYEYIVCAPIASDRALRYMWLMDIHSNKIIHRMFIGSEGLAINGIEKLSKKIIREYLSKMDRENNKDKMRAENEKVYRSGKLKL